MARKGYEPKRRNSGNRPRVRIAAIALEGDNKTERQYFSDLAREYQGRLAIRFASGNKTDPEAMMRELLEAVDILDLDNDDLAFCLVDSDCDQSKDAQMQAADRLAKSCSRLKVRQIVSSPCFELWYLLHFEYIAEHFSRSSKVVERLKSRHITDYGKAKEGMYALLRENQDMACARARMLAELCTRNGVKLHTVAFTPSTEMYKVIELIKKMS